MYQCVRERRIVYRERAEYVTSLGTMEADEVSRSARLVYERESFTLFIPQMILVPDMHSHHHFCQPLVLNIYKLI